MSNILIFFKVVKTFEKDMKELWIYSTTPELVDRAQNIFWFL